jgi:predicted DNA-binding protein
MERTTDGRDFMLRVRMSRKEKRMLEDLIKETGLTASNVVRQAIRAEARRAKRAA